MKEEKQPIQEHEIVRANLLVTDDMFATMPAKAKTIESYGHRKILHTDENGVMLGGVLAEGYHMVLEMNAKDLGLWLYEIGKFYMWNSNLGKFQNMNVVKTEADDDYRV